jgi:hypothetical protein
MELISGSLELLAWFYFGYPNAQTLSILYLHRQAVVFMEKEAPVYTTDKRKADFEQMDNTSLKSKR